MTLQISGEHASFHCPIPSATFAVISSAKQINKDPKPTLNTFLPSMILSSIGKVKSNPYLSNISYNTSYFKYYPDPFSNYSYTYGNLFNISYAYAYVI